MSEQCQIPRCEDFQRVLVRDPEGDAMRICVGHWREALERSSGAICGISLPGCLKDAKTNAPDLQGGEVPACREHLDDLSWIEMGLDLGLDAPGWSHG